MVKINFQTKLTIIFIAALVTVLLVTNYFVYRKAIIEQKEELRGKILSLVKLASMMVDGDLHSQIKLERESQNTASYQEIKKILTDIRNIDSVIDNVYTMVKTNEKDIWAFVVDSGDRQNRSIAYCGEYYNISRFPEMGSAFNAPNVDKNLTRDKWGIWLSGYAPIYNRQGQAVAIVGLDVSAQSIHNLQMVLIRRFLWVLLFGIIFSIWLGWFVAKSITNPLRSLMEGVREVGKGNLEHTVLVKSKDELEELAISFNKMTDALLKAQKKLHRSFLNTIKALAQALEAKDPYTRGHSERVTHYAVNIGKHLGLDAKDIETLQEVCVLHDVGKIGMPERVLTKPAPLTEEEWKIMQKHPHIGEEILNPIDFIKEGISIIRDHHERLDGKGYPRGLKGNQISQLAAITGVADAYDAMTTDRPYRKGLSKEEAIAILEQNKGTQFDSRAVEAFIEFLRESA
jgi:HD-GYP domain-containing protein (c-di-GMP phosphodiesterase class II)